MAGAYPALEQLDAELNQSASPPPALEKIHAALLAESPYPDLAKLDAELSAQEPTPNEMMARALLPQLSPPMTVPQSRVTIQPTVFDRLSQAGQAVGEAFAPSGPLGEVSQLLGGINKVLSLPATVLDYLSPSTAQGLRGVSAGLGNLATESGQLRQQLEQQPVSLNPLTQTLNLGRRALALGNQGAYGLGSILTDPEQLGQLALFEGAGKLLGAGSKAAELANISKAESERATQAMVTVPEEAVARLEAAAQTAIPPSPSGIPILQGTPSPPPTSTEKMLAQTAVGKLMAKGPIETAAQNHVQEYIADVVSDVRKANKPLADLLVRKAASLTPEQETAVLDASQRLVRFGAIEPPEVQNISRLMGAQSYGLPGMTAETETILNTIRKQAPSVWDSLMGEAGTATRKQQGEILSAIDRLVTFPETVSKEAIANLPETIGRLKDKLIADHPVLEPLLSLTRQTLRPGESPDYFSALIQAPRNVLAEAQQQAAVTAAKTAEAFRSPQADPQAVVDTLGRAFKFKPSGAAGVEAVAPAEVSPNALRAGQPLTPSDSPVPIAGGLAQAGKPPSLIREALATGLSREAELRALQIPEAQTARNLLNQQLTLYRKIAGNYLGPLRRLYDGLTDAQALESWRVIGKEATTTDVMAGQAAKARAGFYQQAFQEAKDAGLKRLVLEPQADGTVKRIEMDLVPRANFQPQFIDGKYLVEGSPERAELDTYLAETGQAVSKSAADTMMGAYREAGLSGPYGHVEFARRLVLPDRFLAQGQSADLAYFQGLARRIASVKTWGRDGETLDMLTASVRSTIPNLQGAVLAKRLELIVQGATGKMRPPSIADVVIPRLIAAETFISLSRFALSNITESVMTALLTNVKRVVPQLVKFMVSKTSRKEMEYALADAGYLLSDIAETMTNDLGALGPGEKTSQAILRAYGGPLTESVTQMLAPGAIKAYIRELARDVVSGGRPDAARKILLERFKIDPELAVAQKGLLTNEQLRGGMIEGLRLLPTFRDPMQIAEFTRSNTGRLWTFLHNFNLRSGKLIKDAVLTDAGQFFKTGGREGRIGPLLTLLGPVTQIPGEVVNDIKAAIDGRQRSHDLSTRYWENAMQVVGLGFFQDIVDAAGRLDRLQQFAQGKIVSDAVKVFDVVSTSWRQRTLNPIAKLLTRQVPVLGRRLSPPRPSGGGTGTL